MKCMQYKIDTSGAGYIWVFERYSELYPWVKLKSVSSVNEGEEWISNLARVKGKIYEIK